MSLLAPCAMALTPFEALYTIRISIVRGESQVSLRRGDDGVYVYEAHTRPKGLIGLFVHKDIREVSRFRLSGDTLVPLSYERTDTISAEQRDLALEFDWERGIVISQFDDTRAEAAIPDGAIDPGVLAVAVMLDRQHGRTPGPYVLIERGRTETIEVQNEGEESLKTKAGRYDTTRYAHDSVPTRRTTRLWSAPALDHLMVQMAQYKDDKVRARLTLKQIEFAADLP